MFHDGVDQLLLSQAADALYFHFLSDFDKISNGLFLERVHFKSNIEFLFELRNMMAALDMVAWRMIA